MNNGGGGAQQSASQQNNVGKFTICPSEDLELTCEEQPPNKRFFFYDEHHGSEFDHFPAQYPHVGQPIFHPTAAEGLGITTTAGQNEGMKQE
jgi:hypothetical protein